MDSQIELLNSVLGLSIGQVRVLRESHLFPMTAHRYRDGWTFFLDHVPDEAGGFRRPVLGWFFAHPEDVADFLIGDLGPRLSHFAILGDRP